MSDRWRKRLEHLDGASPSDEVFRRAQEGPRIPDDPAPGPSTSTRVVTGVTAFAIFALAISVFAIPALRLRDEAAGIRDTSLLPLWPVRTLDQAEVAQAYADGSELPSGVDLTMFKWPPNLLRADAVAHHFARHVLGWENPTVVPVDEGTYVHPSGSQTPSTGPYPPPGPTSGGPMCTPVAYPGTVGPSASLSIEVPSRCLDGSTGAPSPFRRFAIYDLPLDPSGASATGGDTIDLLPYFTPSVSITMYQPLGSGEGHLWTVLEVDESQLELGMSPNERLRVGERIEIQSSWDPDLVQAGMHIGASEGCDLEAGVLAVEGLRFTVPAPPPGSGCEEFEPGYVYAFAIRDQQGRQHLDPIADGSSQRLLGMAAVPIVVHIPPTETVGAPTQSTPLPEDQAADDLTWVTYTDPRYGWTIEYPEEWTVGWFDVSNGRYVTIGMFTSSGHVEKAPGAGGEPDVTVPAEGEVMLKLWHREGGPSPTPLVSDSSFPLAFDDLEPDGIYLADEFQGDGHGFTIRVSTGEAHATGEVSRPTAEQEQVLRRIVSSISFEPWTVGETRNGWTAFLPLDDPSVRPDGSLTFEGSYWREGIGYLVQMEPLCPGVGWDFSGGDGPRAVCEDGREGRWSWDGTPDPGNPQGLTGRLEAVSAIVSWDRHLLVRGG